MATMTAEPKIRAKQIKTAINSLGKDEWTEKLLEILDENLTRRIFVYAII